MKERLTNVRTQEFREMTLDVRDRTIKGHFFFYASRPTGAFFAFQGYYRRARSSQKATALAAATFRESTPWLMGMRTV